MGGKKEALTKCQIKIQLLSVAGGPDQYENHLQSVEENCYLPGNGGEMGAQGRNNFNQLVIH